LDCYLCIDTIAIVTTNIVTIIICIINYYSRAMTYFTIASTFVAIRYCSNE